jgi:hypothetical protein|tara:strand:- start:601 stop:774 length:174 start_codon:yes stop_codon:yes gene_type:complete
MSKKKKDKKNKIQEDISDIVGSKKIKKSGNRNSRHQTNQFTRKYGDDIEFSENFEKF